MKRIFTLSLLMYCMIQSNLNLNAYTLLNTNNNKTTNNNSTVNQSMDNTKSASKPTIIVADSKELEITLETSLKGFALGAKIAIESKL